jgi:hypothetical protein
MPDSAARVAHDWITAFVRKLAVTPLNTTPLVTVSIELTTAPLVVIVDPTETPDAQISFEMVVAVLESFDVMMPVFP